MLSMRVFPARYFLFCVAVVEHVPLRSQVRPKLTDLQQRWDETNFRFAGDEQEAAFESLQADAEAYAAAHPEDADAWIWSGIIKSSFAGAKGGLGALGLAKAARKDFERALELDPEAMRGSAYTSLGTLYFSVPGWPVGFGDDEKAEELLLQGLKADPDGIDSNYFYAEYPAQGKALGDARNATISALSRRRADPGARLPIGAAWRRYARHWLICLDSRCKQFGVAQRSAVKSSHVDTSGRG